MQTFFLSHQRGRHCHWKISLEIFVWSCQIPWRQHTAPSSLFLPTKGTWKVQDLKASADWERRPECWQQEASGLGKRTAVTVAVPRGPILIGSACARMHVFAWQAEEWLGVHLFFLKECVWGDHTTAFLTLLFSSCYCYLKAKPMPVLKTLLKYCFPHEIFLDLSIEVFPPLSASCPGVSCGTATYPFLSYISDRAQRPKLICASF